MEGRWLFRADPNYRDGQKVVCKNPMAQYKVGFHVGFGSENTTQFISTTARLCIAAIKYSGGQIGDDKKERDPIVLVDFEKMKSMGEKLELTNGEQYIYDFTDSKIIKKYIAGKTQQNYVKADREVTVNREIPAECCKEIPPIFVDILMALETDISQHLEGCDDEKAKAIKEVGKTMSDKILSMIMQGDTKTLNSMIECVQYNDIEKRFISLYYEERQSLAEVAKTMFGDAEQGEFWANAIQVEITKKIMKTFRFRCKTYPNAESYIDVDGHQKRPLRDEFIDMVTDSYISPLAWIKQFGQIETKSYGQKEWEMKSHRFLNKFTDIYIDSDESKKPCLSATAAKNKGSGVKIFETLFLEINKALMNNTCKDDVIFPSGMEYEMGENGIVAATPKCIRYEGRNKRFAEKKSQSKYSELIQKSLGNEKLEKIWSLFSRTTSLKLDEKIIEHALDGVELGDDKQGGNGEQTLLYDEKKGEEALNMTNFSERTTESQRQKTRMEINKNSQEFNINK